MALIVVLTIGVLIGTNLGKDGPIDALLKKNELTTQSFLIEEQLLKTLGTDCKNIQKRFLSTADEVVELAKILEPENTEKEIGTEKYTYLKTRFQLLQIKRYITAHKISENCDGNDVVLYYYGRNEESRKQGLILDEIVKEKDITVIAIEKGHSEETKFLEEYYSIEKAPTLIINFETKLKGLIEKEEIEKFILN